MPRACQQYMSTNFGIICSSHFPFTAWRLERQTHRNKQNHRHNWSLYGTHASATARMGNKKSQNNLGRAVLLPLMQRISLLTMGSPTFTRKTALPLWRSSPHLIHDHPSTDPTHPPQTASRSIQLFCHSTLFGQTDRQTDWLTDGLGDKPVRIPAYVLFII